MSSRAPSSSDVIDVRPASCDERLTGISLLLGSFPPEERKIRLIDVMHSVEQGELSLDGLLIAFVEGRAVGAALAVVQPDRMAFAWTPGVLIPDDLATIASVGAVADRLMSELGAWIDRTPARFAQILIEPDAPPDFVLLRNHGFVPIADLEMRQRWLNEPLAPWTAPAWTTITYDDSLATRFADVIERTYAGSLDCPNFTGYRSGREALESHRSAGVFAPSLWTLFEVDGRDAGVLLIAPQPDQKACELVYTGIVPEFRGRGLGKNLVEYALRLVQNRGDARMCLCVDSSNHYACAIYDAVGLVVEGTRSVWLRWSKPSAA
ncbi:MAG: GNAT family N-acetyltransferase [Planctomycetaceae bacterium]|nr:GNAT family N-acetyltransferase [Planctomycetaceae bacterium]